MKLTELKAKVYDIAKVKTTRQLKAQHAAVQALDMRYKTSWEKALALFNESVVENLEKQASNFEDWLSHPPDEYKALFSEAASALDSFSTKLDTAKRLTKAASAMAESLDEFAEATVAQAQQLAASAERDSELSRQADLN